MTKLLSFLIAISITLSSCAFDDSESPLTKVKNVIQEILRENLLMRVGDLRGK